MKLTVRTPPPGKDEGPICGLGTEVLIDDEPFPIPVRGVTFRIHVDEVVRAELDVTPSGVEIESPNSEVWLKHNGTVLKCYEIERGEPETGVVDMTHMQTTKFGARNFVRVADDKEQAHE